MPIDLAVLHFPMGPLADTETISALGFPTATPVLDVLSPLPNQDPGRLTTGDYFFISSAVILGFTELPVLRQFLDSISHRSTLIFWSGILAVPLLALLASVAVHTTGHVIAGRFTGFDAVRIRIGHFTLRDRLEPTDVLSVGFTVMRPRNAERLRQRLALLVLGGPLANLLMPLLLEAGLRLAQGRQGNYALVPAGIHFFSAISLLSAIGSLLPDINSSGNFSDGTRLLMLLKNDFRASRMLAMIELQLRLKSGEDARQWGQDLVARAVAQQDESFDTVAAHWLAYLWASARQDLGLATKFLETALVTLSASPGHLRDRIFLEAAIFQAWYRHNFVKSKFWVSQIAGLNSLSSQERKRLEIASGWAEGKAFDAWEKLGDYLRWLRELPVSSVHAAAERDAREWKTQMESRMLAGAWATMHSWPYQRQVQRVM